MIFSVAYSKGSELKIVHKECDKGRFPFLKKNHCGIRKGSELWSLLNYVNLKE